MKRILITGGSGYIGTNVTRYLAEYDTKEEQEAYHVDLLSLRDASWEDYDFSSYDTILHLAGKAHADMGHVSEEIREEYYRINCELAVRTAIKAKEQGVPQFVYMSSVIVYGESAKVGQTKHITAETQPAPANFYGDSKWQAEQKLGELEGICVAIVRSPMVYGKGSKGNFPLLVKLAEKLPVFPDVKNERSMIYIDNLAEFLRQLIESGQGGIYLPQNAEYVTTAEMVKAIGAAKGRTIHLVKVLNPLVKLVSKMPGKIGGMVNKAFGSLTIARDNSKLTEASGQGLAAISGYQVCDFQESIVRSVAHDS